MNIAWIGTGVMGHKMVSHLVGKGYNISVYNRSPEKTLGLDSQIKVCHSIKDTVTNADIVFSIVGYPQDVEEVINETFKYVKEGTIIVDMTTSTTSLAINLASEGLKRKVIVLDAPVTGGESGAKDGILSVMVGGNPEGFQKILPIIKHFGKTITYMGLAGSGQRTKSINQISIAGNLLGTVESLYSAMESGLDLNKIYEVISKGSASSWQFISNGQKIIDDNYKPGFYIKHFLKDLTIAKEATKKPLLGVQLVINMLQTLVDNNYGDAGTQALILYYLDEKIKKA